MTEIFSNTSEDSFLLDRSEISRTACSHFADEDGAGTGTGVEVDISSSDEMVVSYFSGTLVSERAHCSSRDPSHDDLDVVVSLVSVSACTSDIDIDIDSDAVSEFRAIHQASISSDVDPSASISGEFFLLSASFSDPVSECSFCFSYSSS